MGKGEPANQAVAAESLANRSCTSPCKIALKSQLVFRNFGVTKLHQGVGARDKKIAFVNGPLIKKGRDFVFIRVSSPEMIL